MGNYFNKLRWKIIRAKNLLQLIHQVTIEIRFRNQIILSNWGSVIKYKEEEERKADNKRAKN